jgi:hypothetical protein
MPTSERRVGVKTSSLEAILRESGFADLSAWGPRSVSDFKRRAWESERTQVYTYTDSRAWHAEFRRDIAGRNTWVAEVAKGLETGEECNSPPDR